MTTSTRADTRRAIWNTIRGSSGNLVEWYDVYIYTVFASYFEGQFFDESEKNSTVYVYAIFAVTFLMRPVGSWFFGRFADRRGRRAALTISVSVIGGVRYEAGKTDRERDRGRPDAAGGSARSAAARASRRAARRSARSR